MPRKDIILSLPGFAIKKVSGYNPLVIDVHYRNKPRCPHCNGKKLRKKSSYIRRVRHEPIGYRQPILQFKAYKFYCRDCRRYFNQQFPGIHKHQRSTQRLQNHIFHRHTEGVSQKSLARDFKLGKATIERWYHKEYLLAHSEIHVKHCPTVLGIDEHFFSKKQGYATKNKRGILAALRTKPENLSSKRLIKRDDYLKKQPVIESIYHFNQKLYRILMKKTMSKRMCRRIIPVFLNVIKSLKQSPFKKLKTLDKTLHQWRDEVVRMWRFTKTNGITEGFHRKMKLIQRRAYGFRNFENYRLRVKVLCS